MSNFERWNDRYQKFWCTKEQLRKLVVLGLLSAEEFKLINGEDYE